MSVVDLVLSVVLAGTAPGSLMESTFVPPSDPRVAVMGRVDREEPGRVRMGYPGVTWRLRFEGASLTMRVGCDTPNSHVAVIVDGDEPRILRLQKGDSELDAQAHLVCYGGRGLLRDWRGRSDVLTGPQLFGLAVPDEVGPPAWDHSLYTPDVVFVSLGTNDFNLATGPLPEREGFVSAYVRFVGAIRARHPEAHVFLSEGAIVNDDADPKRPQKTVLREYLTETVRRLGDARVHLAFSRHYPGDAQNAHPTREQHAAMARDLEPVIRQALGW